MRLSMERLRQFSSSLFARVAVILLLGLLASQLTSIWLQSDERAAAVSQARGQNFVGRIAEAIRLLESVDPGRRSATLAALQSPELQVLAISESEVSPVVPHGQIQTMIRASLGSERDIRSNAGGGGMQQRMSPVRSFDIRLRDGQWIRVTASVESAAPALPNKLIVQLLATLAIIIAVVMIAVRQVSEPLKQLARAADSFGQDLDAPPLRESGSAETRRAAQAFNRMQARIKRLMDDRARALAAVSHDLRTPLTRMRLRAELVDDEKLREQMVADLDAMAVMIDATLDYMRGLRDSEAPRRIDMNALLQSLAEDAGVLGRNIRIEGAAGSPYPGRLSGLRRALQNLIDNAVKYGQGAQIRIRDDASALRIAVEDEGPGIPPDELERVTEPYYRPDASRSRETGGVGLGLSIVKDIVLMHGGELLLANRPGGGFSATMVLPRTPTLA
ncbi:MAG: periplasmic sensor signal transduction histidine kinase [Proteobacteria bacterium]|nr:periplasmic sensor signal transduction histidine kinase [Pseudomonadota bacterium]